MYLISGVATAGQLWGVWCAVGSQFGFGSEHDCCCCTCRNCRWVLQKITALVGGAQKPEASACWACKCNLERDGWMVEGPRKIRFLKEQILHYEILYIYIFDWYQIFNSSNRLILKWSIRLCKSFLLIIKINSEAFAADDLII